MAELPKSSGILNAEVRPGTLVALYDRNYRVADNRIATGRRRTRLMWLINIASLFLTATALAAGFFLSSLIHDFSASYQLTAGIVILLILIITLIVSHELVHLLGYRCFGRVPGSQVKLGFNQKSLLAYAICLVPMNIKATRRSLLLPLWICGLLPLTAGIVMGSPLLIVAGSILTGGSAGDLWYVWDLRRLHADDHVLEAIPDVSGYAMGVLVMKPISTETMDQLK